MDCVTDNISVTFLCMKRILWICRRKFLFLGETWRSVMPAPYFPRSEGKSVCVETENKGGNKCGIRYPKQQNIHA